MKYRIIISITIVIFLITMITAPVLADSYKYTGTGFRYIGDIFHEKEFTFYGGSGFFQVIGYGFVTGSHDIHTSAEKAVYGITTERKVNIDMYFRGTTDPGYGLSAARLERELLANVENRRLQAIAALDLRFRTSQTMTAEEYYNQMIELDRHYDEMRSGIIAAYSRNKNNVRIISNLKLNATSPTASMRTGVDMDPGETGFIRQSVAAIRNSEGSHLRIDNHYGNTGGTTKREMSVTGFLSERMHVEGYAEVWESTQVRKGTARTGFWNAMP